MKLILLSNKQNPYFLTGSRIFFRTCFAAAVRAAKVKQREALAAEALRLIKQSLSL